nr:MAG TPA: hypothetical protein [Caudoviricetes sp.]
MNEVNRSVSSILIYLISYIYKYIDIEYIKNIDIYTKYIIYLYFSRSTRK